MLLMYSITCTASFEATAEWRTRIVRAREGECPAMVLIGCKSDLEKDRKVPLEEGQLLAVTFDGCPFLEVSSKTCTNVSESYEELAREIIKREKHGERGRPRKKCEVM